MLTTALTPDATSRIFEAALDTKNRHEKHGKDLSVYVDLYGATYRVDIPPRPMKAHIFNEQHGNRLRKVISDDAAHVAIDGQDLGLREAWDLL